MKGQLLVIIVSRNGFDQSMGMIEGPADCKVVVRHADKSSMLSGGFTWVKVELRNCDGSAAGPRSNCVRFQDGWTLKEAIVDAGSSEVPLQWADDIRTLPPLSNNVRVCKHKVEKPGERQGDPSRFNVTTASYSDRG